jgi:hypothetical protein
MRNTMDIAYFKEPSCKKKEITVLRQGKQDWPRLGVT